MPIFHMLAAAAAASAPVPPVQAARVPDHPALWVVNDDDTVIYLFGTFHALDGNVDWFEQAVKTAFSASDQLMLETLVPESTLPPPSPPQLRAPAVAGQRATVVSLAPSAPTLLAASKTVMTAGRTRGMSTDRGADAVLREAAEETGKHVGGLETFQFQLNMFNTLADTPSSKPPDAESMRALSRMLGQLEAAWNRGDIEDFAPILRQMQTQSPEMYKTMFVDRNARWAKWIANRLASPGTVFVAVGAGHLSGPDSVQNQLAGLGVKSARIN